MKNNFLYNQKVFEDLKTNPGEKSVFSRDGFIEYQAGLSNARYGSMPASHGACGAIAVWNILKAFRVAPEIAVVFEEMERGAVLGSRLGTEVFFIKKYLSGRGHRINMYFTQKEFNNSFSCAGIVYYMKNNFRAHYVAFTPAGVNDNGEKLYRFHNAATGSYWKEHNGVKYIENIPMTMNDFLDGSGAKLKVFYDVR